ncbi:MAG: hypothetical protein ISQ32_03950 [Rickettsiales bacterium]|nr:hypothetical protein [Rickettsiales bacterium]
MSPRSAFTLIDILITITVIAFLILIVSSSNEFVKTAKIKTANLLTKSSSILTITNDRGEISTKLWLEASDERNYLLNSNNNIETWYDLSPYKNHISQNNASNMPILQKFIINNRAHALYFSGDDFLYNEGQTPLAFGQDNYSIAAVWKNDELTTGVIWEQNSSLNSSGIVNYARASLTADSSQTINFSSENNNANGLSYSNNQNNITIITKDDRNIDFYNLDQNSTAILSNSTNLYNEIHIIGRKGSQASEFFKGYIAEIIVFDKKLSEDEIKLVQYYLFSKYGENFN